jgi:hypothetical protein
MNPGEVLMRVSISSVEAGKTPPPGIFEPPASTVPSLEFPPGQNSVTVDFDFAENYISLPVSINGMPAGKFGFDTGATNAIATKWARAKGLKFDAAGASMGGGAGEAATGMATVNRIDIGGLRMTDESKRIRGRTTSGELERRTGI